MKLLNFHLLFFSISWNTSNSFQRTSQTSNVSPELSFDKYFCNFNETKETIQSLFNHFKNSEKSSPNNVSAIFRKEISDWSSENTYIVQLYFSHHLSSIIQLTIIERIFFGSWLSIFPSENIIIPIKKVWNQLIWVPVIYSSNILPHLFSKYFTISVIIFIRGCHCLSFHLIIHNSILYLFKASFIVNI